MSLNTIIKLDDLSDDGDYTNRFVMYIPPVEVYGGILSSGDCTVVEDGVDIFRGVVKTHKYVVDLGYSGSKLKRIYVDSSYNSCDTSCARRKRHMPHDHYNMSIVLGAKKHDIFLDEHVKNMRLNDESPKNNCIDIDAGKGVGHILIVPRKHSWFDFSVDKFVADINPRLKPEKYCDAYFLIVGVADDEIAAVVEKYSHSEIDSALDTHVSKKMNYCSVNSGDFEEI